MDNSLGRDESVEGLIADDEINIILLIKSLIDRQKTDVEIAGKQGTELLPWKWCAS
ncbi:MAG: hypothetical protein ACLRMD_05300 [Ruminococcus sp.]